MICLQLTTMGLNLVNFYEGTGSKLPRTCARPIKQTNYTWIAWRTRSPRWRKNSQGITTTGSVSATMIYSMATSWWMKRPTCWPSLWVSMHSKAIPCSLNYLAYGNHVKYAMGILLHVGRLNFQVSRLIRPCLQFCSLTTWHPKVSRLH